MRPCLTTTLACFLALLVWFPVPVRAGDTDPLFINMTTDDAHRSGMAIGYGANQFKRGHPLTIFCNDKGVLVAARTRAANYPDQQKMLTGLAASGATVLVCPTCMAHYGVKEADLLPGLKVSTPESTGQALFREGARSLSW